MIQDANRFYDSYRWKLIRQDQITQADGNLGVLVLESLREGSRVRILYGFKVGDRYYADGIAAKFAQLRLIGRDDKTVRALFVSQACTPETCSNETDTLVTLIRQLGGA